MANSSEDVMQRIARLETNVDDLKGAVVHIVNLLIEQGERMDARMERMDARMERIETRMESMDAGIQAVTERLDRLITVSIQERTFGIERLAELERRIARLEAHTGVQ
jgi:phage shock protein A